MSRPLVTVVIPNWNGQKFLKIVLPSLARQSLRSFQTVVVDNGSDDGSLAYLRRYHPSVHVISRPTNEGFAVAINYGLRYARTEYVALLNNDIELDPRWLDELVRALKDHPEAASATGKMLDYRRRDRFDDAGDQVSWYATTTKRGEGECDRGQYNKPEAIFSASGGASLFRRKVFNDIGLLDEDFFAYIEDVDWGFRAQLAGWECRWVPAAVVYHLGSATSGKTSHFTLYLCHRNTLWLIAKNFPGSRIVLNLHKLTFFFAKTLLGSIRDKWFRTLMRAWLTGLWKMPRMLRKRWQIQRRRQVSLAHLDGLVLSSFPHPSRILGYFGRARPARTRYGRGQGQR